MAMHIKKHEPATEINFRIFSASEVNQDHAAKNFLDEILHLAIAKGASDIHFEPYQTHQRIRFRLDGILYQKKEIALNLGIRLASMLKIMARLDIGEKRLPQDGRFSLNYLGKIYDFRLSTCPTLFGEKLAVRILNPDQISLDPTSLGLSENQHLVFEQAIRAPQGMILVTGPTGSGKTVTLYSTLNQLNRPEKNISTVEDPIEIVLPGINQVEINPKIGLTFASVLRSFLRQDPDIIMVGEIRDLETAQIALKAAQTGHLVLATLHTNSAAESLTRLINMGVSAFNLSGSLSLVIAQRLVRKICLNCQAKIIGCEKCHQGYHGRTGIFELFSISSEIKEMISKNCSPLEIERKARLLGMTTLSEAAEKKVAAKITDLKEINRVL
jgi:type IV pilus assembly protein PilB